MTDHEKFEIMIHCLKVSAEEEVCEECKIYGNCHTDCKEVARYAIEAMEELRQYRNLGSIDYVRSACVRQDHKRPEFVSMLNSVNGVFACPNCHTYFMHDCTDTNLFFCQSCGQALQMCAERD